MTDEEQGLLDELNQRLHQVEVHSQLMQNKWAVAETNFVLASVQDEIRKALTEALNRHLERLIADNASLKSRVMVLEKLLTSHGETVEQMRGRVQ